MFIINWHDEVTQVSTVWPFGRLVTSEDDECIENTIFAFFGPVDKFNMEATIYWIIIYAGEG